MFQGNTALHYAVSNCNMDVVNLLLRTDVCDVNHRNKTGCTAVMMAALTEVKSERHQEVVRQLFEMGDVNLQAPNDGSGELVRILKFLWRLFLKQSYFSHRH